MSMRPDPSVGKLVEVAKHRPGVTQKQTSLKSTLIHLLIDSSFFISLVWIKAAGTLALLTLFPKKNMSPAFTVEGWVVKALSGNITWDTEAGKNSKHPQ